VIATQPRPGIVKAAFWSLLVGAVLLIAGGLLAFTLTFDVVRPMVDSSIANDVVERAVARHHAAGIGCIAAGLLLGFLAGRTRTGDARFRRATIGLGLAITVLVAAASVFTGIHLLAVLSLIPIIVGTVLLTRPAATTWFDADDTQEQIDE
jgi:hypothetical protein